MKLVCGLGNPGNEYEQTRHNAGFMICEILGQRHGILISSRKFSGRTGSGRIGNQKVVLLLPSTYMNRSGQSVMPAIHFYKLELEELIVIHDDVDLDPGRVVVKEGGGTGGHKGLKSIIQHVGTPEFIRVRFGIGRPENPRIDVSDFVLQKFDSIEKDLIKERQQVAADAVETILSQGHEYAANQYNARNFRT